MPVTGSISCYMQYNFYFKSACGFFIVNVYKLCDLHFNFYEFQVCVRYSRMTIDVKDNCCYCQSIIDRQNYVQNKFYIIYHKQ